MIANMNGGFNPSGTINITSNGSHNVKEYATANVNVQSAPVLLWTNPSPTSDFQAQTVSMPTGYSAYFVEYRYSKSEDSRGIAYLPFSSSERFVLANGTFRYGGSTNEGVFGRKINSASNGSIVFGLGKWATLAGNYSALDPSVGIPTRIWGVKFTL